MPEPCRSESIGDVAYHAYSSIRVPQSIDLIVPSIAGSRKWKQCFDTAKLVARMSKSSAAR
jgi:hypothetical protein